MSLGQVESNGHVVVPASNRSARTCRRWAWLLGFCLPLSGGLPISDFIDGYPDQLTPIRLVTLAAFAWLFVSRQQLNLPRASHLMVTSMGAVMTYAALSLVWTPDKAKGLQDIVTAGMAIWTAVVLLVLVGRDRRVLAAFAGGFLTSGVIQTGFALLEIRTGFHFSASAQQNLLTAYGVPDIETLTGRVAWGTLGNPQDLAAFLLIAVSVFWSRRGFGLTLSRPLSLLGHAVVIATVWVAWGYMNDARAFRLGIASLLLMHAFDRFLGFGRPALRLFACLFLGWFAIAFAATQDTLGAIRQSSDSLRLTLISDGFRSALETGGFGRGIGAERTMVSTGVLQTNLHDVVASLLNDLGVVVTLAFLGYLIYTLGSWTLVTRSARLIGQAPALARASLTVSLLWNGITVSGVMDSPVYWTMFGVTAALAGVAPPISGDARRTHLQGG